jgi:signal peptidase I
MNLKELFRSAVENIFEFIQIAVMAAIIVIPIRYFILQPFFVKGASMEPNFHDGEYLIIDEISYRFKDIMRGDVVVFKYPLDQSQYYIKRIIGLPGDTVRVRDGDVLVEPQGQAQRLLLETYLPDQKITYSAGGGELVFHLKEGEYFVLGDNRKQSSDSRVWGVVKKDLVTGKVLLRAWPVNEAEVFLSFPQPELVTVLQ